MVKSLIFSTWIGLFGPITSSVSTCSILSLSWIGTQCMRTFNVPIRSHSLFTCFLSFFWSFCELEMLIFLKCLACLIYLGWIMCFEFFLFWHHYQFFYPWAWTHLDCPIFEWVREFCLHYKCCTYFLFNFLFYFFFLLHLFSVECVVRTKVFQ